MEKEKGGQVRCLGDKPCQSGSKEGRKIKLVERINYLSFMGSKPIWGMEDGGEVNSLGWQAAQGT